MLSNTELLTVYNADRLDPPCEIRDLRMQAQYWTSASAGHAYATGRDLMYEH